MHRSSLLSFVLLATLAAAIPVPFGHVYENEPQANDAEATVGAARIDRAVAAANVQIGHMDTTLQAAIANPKGPEAAIVKQAFGPQAFSKTNIAQIQDTVNKMKSNAPENRLRLHSADKTADQAENVRHQTASENAYILNQPIEAQDALVRTQASRIDTSDFNAFTLINKNWDTGAVSTGKVVLGNKFHADKAGQTQEYRDEYRGGALIHEYAHQHGLAGDDVTLGRNGAQGMIRPVGAPDLRAGTQKQTGGGYASTSSKPIRTEADLSQGFKDLRDTSPNMAWNADSYRVFGGLCSPHRLRRRALLEDDPASWYLAKRQQCELPPDYFEKKAAARAAAAAKEKAAIATPKDAKKPSLQSAAAKLKAANAFKQGVKSKQPTSATAKSLKDAKKPTLKSAATKLKAMNALQKGAKSKRPTSAAVKGPKAPKISKTSPTRSRKVKAATGKSALGRKGPNKVKGPAGKAGKSTVGRKGTKKAGVKTPKAKVPKSPKKKTTTTRGIARKGGKGKATKVKVGGRAKATKGKTTKAAGKKAVARKATRGGASKGRVAKPAKKATVPQRPRKTASRAAVKKAPTPKAQVVTSKAVKKGGKSRRSLLDELD